VLSTLHTLLLKCYVNGANDHLDDPTLYQLDETVMDRTLDILMTHTKTIEELTRRQDYEFIPVILEVIGHISLEGEGLETFKKAHFAHRMAMLRSNLSDLRDTIEKCITSLSNREVLEVADVAELVSLFQIEEHAIGLDKYLFPPVADSKSSPCNESVECWIGDQKEKMNQLWSQPFKAFMALLGDEESLHLGTDKAKSLFVRLDRMAVLHRLLPCVNQDTTHMFDNLNATISRVVRFDVSVQKTGSDLLQLLELSDALILLVELVQDSALLRDGSNDMSQRFRTNMAGLREWQQKATNFIQEHLSASRFGCRDALAAKNGKQLGHFLDVLFDFAELTGYIKYIKPAPQALYDDARNDIKQEINAMITSSQHAVDRGELEKAAAIRLFLEGSAAFEKHFEDVDFRAYCSDLLQKHRRAADHLPDEIDDLLDKHKFSAVRNKLRNLMSHNSEESATPADPVDRLIFEAVAEQISEWFSELLARIMDEAGSELSEPELTTTMEAHLRLVGSAMVLEGTTLTCSPLKLLDQLYSICDEQFKRLKNRLLKMLAGHRFQQASQVYLQLKRLKNLDRTLQPLLDKLESGSSLFAPRIDDIITTTIEPIGKCAHAACLKHLGSTENFAGDGDWTSISVDNNSLTALLSNTRTAVTSSDVLMDDLVDFFTVQLDLVVTVTKFTLVLLSRVQEVIGAVDGDLSTAEELLEIADNVIGTLCAHTEESNGIKKIKQRLETQQKALEARQSKDVSCVVFSSSFMSKSSVTLKGQRGTDWALYITQLNAINAAFMRDLEPIRELMKSDQMWHQDEAKKIFRFIDAMLIFKHEILSEAPLNESMAECEDCVGLFLDCVFCQVDFAQKAVEASSDVIYMREQLAFLKCSLEQTLHYAQGDLAKDLDQAIAHCERNIHQSDQVVAAMNNDAAQLRTYDLFAQLDTDDMINKLERLSKQKSSTRKRASFGSDATGSSDKENLDQVKASLSKELDGVVAAVPALLEHKKYNVVRNAFVNVSKLKAFEPLAKQAQSVRHEMVSQVQSAHSRISDTFREAVRQRDFKLVNKSAEDATAVDKHLQLCFPTGTALLMDQIKAYFGRELTAIHREHMNAIDSLTLPDHAHNLFLIKELVSEISNQEVQHMAESFIAKYLNELKRSNVDFMHLGMILQGEEFGALGAEITEQYSQFQMVLAKRFNEATAGITIDHALIELKKCNPGIITSGQTVILKRLAEIYNEKVEDDLRRFLPGYSSMRADPIDSLVDKIRKQSSASKRSPEDIATLLAHIFALNCILTSTTMFVESSYDKSCLRKPHAVQILALFRLLGLDFSTGFWKSLSKMASDSLGLGLDAISGHLAQVGTGEGKSILLGGLSAVLALLGYEVSCASYSKHLSERDYNAFKPLFEALKITGNVSYSTLSDLVEQVISRSGSVRDLADGFVLSGKKMVAQRMASKQKRILLIDEVDVFFSDDFFGGTYNPACTVSGPEVVEMLQHIWNTRRCRLSLESIQQLGVYQELKAKFVPAAYCILDLQIREMLDDVNNFQNPRYEVVPDADGDVKIGYRKLDSICFNTSHGYRTAFAYLHEATRHPSIQNSLDRKLSIDIMCGCYSFAAIAQDGFDCIMGVTGTLDCLSDAEKQIIENDFNIPQRTIMPSMYGASKLDFKKDRDVVAEPDANRHFQTVLKEIIDEREKGRPVLVYFRSTEEMERFTASEYGQRLGEHNKVTEETDNLPFFVNKATTAGTVTLMPAVFGRGLDFVSRDSAVDAAGGVHVIQTYFSEDLSEEIQTKGRTARQAKKGSYKMILSCEQLAEKLKMTPQHVQQVSESSIFYDTISAERKKFVAKRIVQLKEKANRAKAVHTETRNLVNQMRQAAESPNVASLSGGVIQSWMQLLAG
jgi:hypothetical protein